MSFCHLCQSLGAWLTSEETAAAVMDFLDPQPLVRKWNITKFSHHGHSDELRTAAEEGCPLCQLILKTGGLEKYPHPHSSKDSDVELGPLVFELHPNSSRSYIYCKGEGWCSAIELEIYIHRPASEASRGEGCTLESESKVSDIVWKRREHLDDHPLSGNTLKHIRGWMAECIEQHEECKKSPYSGYWPTRLIDVGPSDGSREPFLVETKEISRQDLRTSSNPLLPKTARLEQKDESNTLVHYSTLSHRWGESRSLITTMEKLSALKSSIPISSMSRTFVDAVTVTRGIGLQYLWIDSLCIIQDSIEDWQQESSKMCSVYGNAAINITATSSRNSDEGFLHQRPTAVQVMQRNNSQESLDERMPSKALWIWPVVPEVDILRRRAWCFQEVILAPRSLNFGYNEVEYYCRVYRKFETTPELNSQDHALEYYRHPREYKSKFPSLLREDIATEDAYKEAMTLWREMVDSYSSTQLTFPKDTLPAISGLASLLGSATKDKYLAGLWSRDLPLGLCWIALHSEPRKVGPYRAPSWSWASQAGTVFYGFISIKEIHWEVSVLDYGVDCLSDDVYGQVRGGSIKLEGRMIRVEVTKEEIDHNRFCWFVRRGDIKLFEAVGPNYRLESEIKGLWCLLLGTEAQGSERRPVLLVVIEIDDGSAFERVDCIYNYYRDTELLWEVTESLWEDVKRRQITLL